jgi:hypothetical protein
MSAIGQKRTPNFRRYMLQLSLKNQTSEFTMNENGAEVKSLWKGSPCAGIHLTRKESLYCFLSGGLFLFFSGCVINLVSNNFLDAFFFAVVALLSGHFFFYRLLYEPRARKRFSYSIDPKGLLILRNDGEKSRIDFEKIQKLYVEADSNEVGSLILDVFTGPYLLNNKRYWATDPWLHFRCIQKPYEVLQIAQEALAKDRETANSLAIFD